MASLFFADFETTSYNQYVLDKHTRVWSWGLTSLKNPIKDYKHSTNIESFFKEITSTKKDFREKVIFFHNLKFDSEFIVYYITKDLNYTPSKTASTKNMIAKTYSMIKDDRGLLFSVTIQIDTKRKIVLKDSLKLLNFPLSKIAVDFNLNVNGLELLKGDIDYNKYRGVNYVLDENELDYQKRDVLIGALALNELFKLTKINASTIASMAMKSYKKMLPARCTFNDLYPNISYDDWDFIKKAYNGGWCYTNERHQNNIYRATNYKYCGFGIDKNSMYPWIMKTKKLPYGEPFKFNGKYEGKELHITRIYVKASLYEDTLPYFRNNQFEKEKGNYYLDELDGFITITSVDLDMLFKCYDVEIIEYYGGYWFRSLEGVLFNDYINYWYHIKQTSKGAWRAIAKLMLNSLYGKFGASYEHINKISVLENNLLKDIELETSIDENLSYIPMACFITAYARSSIVSESIDVGNDIHLYTDTDSIKIKFDFDTLEEAQKFIKEKGLILDNDLLGAYKIENAFNECKFVRAKTYYYNDLLAKKGEEMSITACGAPTNSKKELIEKILTDGLESFDVGQEVGGKLRPERVVGGIVLVDTTFKIRKNAYII